MLRLLFGPRFCFTCRLIDTMITPLSMRNSLLGQPASNQPSLDVRSIVDGRIAFKGVIQAAASGIQATGLQATRFQATGLLATELQTTGIQATGLPSNWSSPISWLAGKVSASLTVAEISGNNVNRRDSVADQSENSVPRRFPVAKPNRNTMMQVQKAPSRKPLQPSMPPKQDVSSSFVEIALTSKSS